MAKKLGKTAQALLAEIKARGSVCVSIAYGRGMDGGRVSSGRRAFNAGMDLIEAGLAQRRGELMKHTHSNRGYSIHTTDMVLIPVPQPAKTI